MEKITYIDGKSEKGIKYDLNKINALYKKLKCPADTFKPPIKALENHKYIIELSERSTGKTTNWILLGLCMNTLYGTKIQYIRQRESMTTPSICEKLVEVITTYNGGQYIKILTDGKYNSMVYHWKKFYYCNKDENGAITERAPIHCIQILSIDKNYDYKSSYNAPDGDLIILDEFLSKFYAFDEAITFFDLCSTIIRKRESPFIIMLANTIQLRSPYFEELMIQRTVSHAKKGQPISITTDLGTKIYFEIIDRPSNAQKQEHNRLFFGFNNPKLASITGGAVWAFEQVPHIPKCEHTVLDKRLYIQLNNYDYLQLEIVDIDGTTKFFVHGAKKPKYDSIVLTLTEDRIATEQDGTYLYGLGNKRICNLINNALAKRDIYYSSNEVGYDFKNYIRQARLNPYGLE